MFDFLLLFVALMFLVVIYLSHCFNYRVDDSNYSLKVISYKYYFIGIVTFIYIICQYIIDSIFIDSIYVSELVNNLWILAFLFNIVLILLYLIASYTDVDVTTIKTKEGKQVVIPFLGTVLVLFVNYLFSFCLMNESFLYLYNGMLTATLCSILIYYILITIYFSNKFIYLCNYNLYKVIFFSVCLYEAVTVLQLYVNSILLFIFTSIFIILLIQLYMQFVKRINDRLTNVYNADTLRTHIANHSKGSDKFTIILYSISNFKMINKHYGLAYGDEVLKHVAKLLVVEFQESNVYRYSGDEFAVVINNFKKFDEKKIHDVYHKVSSFFSEEHASIAINLLYSRVDYPLFGKDAEQIFLALEYTIHSVDRNNIENNYVYNIGIVEEMRRKNHVCELLKQAIINDGFEVYYQPIYDVKTGRFSQAEALLRMKNSFTTKVYPNEFIPIAEDTGLLTDITYIVLEKVCKDLRSLLDAYGEDMELQAISVNFSYTQFLQVDMIEKVNEILSSYRILPNQIKIELTERALVEDNEIMRSVIRKMQQLGYVFELDDFGVEYSNLNVFLNLEVDIIKIDRSLLLSAFSSVENKQFFEYIMLGIKATNRKVVIEGVEEESMLEFLFSCRCDFIQGYYFSKPLAFNDYITFVFEKTNENIDVINNAVKLFNETIYDPSKNEQLSLLYPKLEKKMDFFVSALNALENPVFIKNYKGEFIFLNEAYKRYFNVEDESLYINNSVLALNFLPYEDRVRYQEEDIALIRENEVKHYKQDFTLSDGSVGKSLYWSTGFSSKVEKGLIGEIVDISTEEILSRELLAKNAELVEAYEKIRSINERDSLTNVYNRRMLNRMIEEPTTVYNFSENFIIKVDLCMFKVSNQKYGREAADSVLIAFTDLLKKHCSINDRIIRYDGEAFIIFIHGFNYEKAIAKIKAISEEATLGIKLIKEEDIRIKYGMTRHIKDELLTDCLERVDALLSKAKQSDILNIVEEY